WRNHYSWRFAVGKGNPGLSNDDFRAEGLGVAGLSRPHREAADPRSTGKNRLQQDCSSQTARRELPYIALSIGKTGDQQGSRRSSAVLITVITNGLLPVMARSTPA